MKLAGLDFFTVLHIPASDVLWVIMLRTKQYIVDICGYYLWYCAGLSYRAAVKHHKARYFAGPLIIFVSLSLSHAMEPQQKAGLPNAEYFHLQGIAESLVSLVDWNELDLSLV